MPGFASGSAVPQCRVIVPHHNVADDSCPRVVVRLVMEAFSTLVVSRKSRDVLVHRAARAVACGCVCSSCVAPVVAVVLLGFR